MDRSKQEKMKEANNPRSVKLESLEDIVAYSRQFAEARGWREYQSPKNIAMALSVECAELVEHFQWLTAEESQAIDGEKKLEVGDEISDVLFYLVRIADILDIDICKAASRKAGVNERKYPLPE